MKIQRASQYADAVCTGPILVRCRLGRCHYARMVYQSQIAVGGKHQLALALSMYPGPFQRIYGLKIVVVLAGLYLLCSLPPGIDSLRNWIVLFTVAIQE